MPSLGVRLLQLANRVLPAPALPGDVDPLDYARWEYDNASSLLSMWDRTGGRPVRRALDVGCGLGGKTHRLRERTGGGVRWTALDLSFAHLRGAGAYLDAAGISDVDRVRADAARLPFADASFDRIVSADALEHLDDPRAALAELRRCVAEDGRVLLLFNPWGSPRGSHLGDLLHLPWCQLAFDARELEEAALLEGERRARRLAEAPARRVRRHAVELVDHFRHHVHPTRIADLRRWLAEDSTFAIEREWRIGPGPLARWPRAVPRPAEEWLSATYGASLRPAASSRTFSVRSRQRSSS